MSTLKRKATSQAGADAKKTKQNASITSFFGAPKPAAGNAQSSSKNSGSAAGPEPSPLKFDKAKWVAGLTPEQKTLLKLEIDTLHESWLAHLKNEIMTKEFLELKKFLDRETAAGKKWFPPMEDVYSWSRHTPLHSVKVVIIGQDPYHNVNQAHGLAFSVRPPTSAPPSLKNMYVCLKNDYPIFTPPPKNGGLLTPWAERGVLMLNTCLTVRAHEANSHSNRGWERFTQKVIDLVAAKRTRGVVFMAWGTPAGKRVHHVDDKRHLVLKAVHPSPLSARRGFLTCGHFKLANEWLATRYGADGVVDWALAQGQSVFPKKGAGEEEGEEEEEKVLAEMLEEEGKKETITEKITKGLTRKAKALAEDNENVDPEEA
ncbi:uracil-DNA glycosylase-like protein [Lasiosphaeris hirsuta]|uniref:Uracil-DNA glycosylase n=1 Tax=Lasiosphaeris hirsuta TaxID=260670 RepID=A0AA40BBN7_9PEZI|nr:uracil-DNA glycosylase-like protein [Lasiosphaeris hirsuta]